MVQIRSSELEAELDSVRDEANRRIRQLDAANQEQAALLQQLEAELLSRRKQQADLEGKLQTRSGALADHSQRAKQLQQVLHHPSPFPPCSSIHPQHSRAKQRHGMPWCTWCPYYGTAVLDRMVRACTLVVWSPGLGSNVWEDLTAAAIHFS